MFDKKAYMRDWREKNKERIRATQTAWRKNNPERVAEYRRRDLERNAETYRRYREEHAEELRVRAQARYAANADRLRAERRAYYREHKDANRIAHALYVAENRECVQAYMRAWRVTEIGLLSIRKSHSRRSARVNGAAGSWTVEQFYARCEFYGWRCYLCGDPLTLSSLVVEHRIPLSRGGSNWPANLAPSCRSCNSRKGTLTEFEYRLRLVGVEVTPGGGTVEAIDVQIARLCKLQDTAILLESLR
jgi:5-methylcytosine-specific restriction endonuclease McrA